MMHSVVIFNERTETKSYHTCNEDNSLLAVNKCLGEYVLGIDHQLTDVLVITVTPQTINEGTDEKN